MRRECERYKSMLQYLPEENDRYINIHQKKDTDSVSVDSDETRLSSQLWSVNLKHCRLNIWCWRYGCFVLYVVLDIQIQN